jgi:DNA repair exonuclease SbcCD ATPase subunit
MPVECCLPLIYSPSCLHSIVKCPTLSLGIPNELQTSSDDNACLAQLSSMMCMTIVQNCNRLEHFIDLQEDYANLQNHLEYLVELQDDYANLQNHLEYLVDLQDDYANLQNHLEYLIDLQDDYANLQNHLEYAQSSSDRRINRGYLAKVYKQSWHCM